jgi:hypothetical protein
MNGMFNRRHILFFQNTCFAGKRILKKSNEVIEELENYCCCTLFPEQRSVRKYQSGLTLAFIPADDGFPYLLK